MHSCLPPEKSKKAQVPGVIGCASMVHQFGPTSLRYKAPPGRWEPKTHGGMQWEIVGGMLGVTEAVVISQELKKRWKIFGVVKSCGELSGVVKGVWEHRGLSQILTDCASSSAPICASDRASDSVHQSAHRIVHQILCISLCISLRIRLQHYLDEPPVYRFCVLAITHQFVCL